LIRLIVRRGAQVIGSGDDLSNFFYSLRHLPEWIPRNCFGHPVDGANYRDYGGVAGKSYYLGFTIICMGDLNAVDLAQGIHHELLFKYGCMLEHEELVYAQTTPGGKLWEGLYIDDHITTAVVSNAALQALKTQLANNPNIRASEFILPSHDHAARRMQHIVDASHTAYNDVNLDRAKDKEFRNEPEFVAWGTQVESVPGWVGTPRIKRKLLGEFILECVQLKTVTRKLLEQLLGLLVHPFSHAKHLMSILQHSYVWLHQLPLKGPVKWNYIVRDELLSAVFMFPFAQSNIRWPISTVLSATDATPLRGGGATSCISVALAEDLYRASEFRGEHVRLDWTRFAELLNPTTMIQPQQRIHDIVSSLT
jgi:hypothetical protein